MEKKVPQSTSRLRLIDTMLLIAIGVVHVIILSKFDLFKGEQVSDTWGVVKILYLGVVAVMFSYLLLKIFFPSKGYNRVSKKLTLLVATLLVRYFIDGIDIYLGSGSWYSLLGATLGALLVLVVILLRARLEKARS